MSKAAKARVDKLLSANARARLDSPEIATALKALSTLTDAPNSPSTAEAAAKTSSASGSKEAQSQVSLCAACNVT